MTPGPQPTPQPTPPPGGQARVVSVQVGGPKTYQWLGRTLVSSIFKERVQGPVRVRGHNLEGDDQSDRDNHGGADKAVYAYAREDEDWWESELGRPVPNGYFGENLTTSGLDLTHAVIGETWHVGTAVLQVTEPRTPCWKLGLRSGDPGFTRRVAASRRPGVLLRILSEGVLQEGDPVRLGPLPGHGVTAAAINRLYYREDHDLSIIHDTPELAAHWRVWADHRKIWHEEDERQGRMRPLDPPTAGQPGATDRPASARSGGGQG